MSRSRHDFQKLCNLPRQNRRYAVGVVTFDEAPIAYLAEIGIHGGADGTRIAAPEAKRATKHSEEEGKVSLSDKLFGQLVREALAARLSPDAAWQGPGGRILIIAAACHCLCFLTFAISDACSTQLRNYILDDDVSFTEFEESESTC
ncbi:hypothetical protein ColTof3_08692 [Colletotrichum tofieldiae]|nr:hypothetical protein ColTof3_08692 [Colletotrichum tofieldiae]